LKNTFANNELIKILQTNKKNYSMKKTNLLLLLVIVFSIIGFSQENRNVELRNFRKDNPDVIKITQTGPKIIAVNGQDEYCIPIPCNCTYGDGFTDFELADIANLGSGCSTDGYGDFTSMLTNLLPGMTYDVTFASGYGDQSVCLWIDANDDTTFDEDERLLTDVAISAAGQAFTYTIDIPIDWPQGEKRLRIRARWNGSAVDPCEVWDYGETEDYTVVISEPLDKDAGVVSINMEEGYGAGEIIPQATVKNYGALTQSFPVHIIIGTYASTINVVDLASGEETIVDFDPWMAELGTYDIEVCTELVGDENTNNDCLFSSVIISGFDVGVTIISIPPEIFPGEHIPKVKVQNFAYQAQTFPVTITIGDYTATETVTDLGPLESVFVEFPVWNATAGVYFAEACTELVGDENPDNDCVTKQIAVGEGYPNFMANETVVLTGLSLPFTETCTYIATAWEWEFEGGDPASSSEKNPIVTYDIPGLYDVALTVTGPNGPETITKTDYISVSDEPQAKWEIVYQNGLWISDIQFYDDNLGYMCGQDGKVFKTEDSGFTWEESPVSGAGGWAYYVRFLSEDEIYVNFYQAKLMKTVDAGQTWEWITPDVPPPCRLFCLGIWDSDHITICGQKTGSTTIDAYTTLSGPGGFVDHITPGGTQYNAMDYLSANEMVMEHFMDITFSHDGGLTFENKDITALFGYFKNMGMNTMAFGSDKVGYIGIKDYTTSLGIIAKTTDAGQSWVELCEGFDPIRGSFFLTENVGFMVGENGFIHKTIDGGENWYGTHLPTVDIEAVYMVNENLVFIASRSGDLFRSTNGFLQQPYFNDISLNEVNLPILTNLESVPLPIPCIVANNGSNPISSFKLNYQVNGGEIFVQDFDNINPPLVNGTTMEATHNTQWSPTTAGDYEIKVWVSNPNGGPDQVTSNDTIIMNVTVIAEPLNNRIVLLEEATGTWCGWCPGGQLEVAYVLETLNQEETQVVGISIHGGDEFEAANADAILSSFGGGAYPAGWVDRYKFFGSPSVGLPGGTWYDRSVERLGLDAPIEVDLNVTYNADDGTINIQEIASVVANSSGNFRYNCYILENGLIAPQANYYNNVAGHPYYGLGDPIPDFEHNHVLRAIVGDTWGTQGDLPTTVSQGETYSHQFTYTVPSGMTIENVHVVGFISYYNEDLSGRSVVNSNQIGYDEFSGQAMVEIELPVGYKFVSSRVIPEDPDMMVVLGDNLNDNLEFARNSTGAMFRKIGPNWVNGIGDWITTEGYLFKMNGADELTILGSYIDPSTEIILNTGYQFVSYLPENAIDALDAFDAIINDDLDFIRNSGGQMLRKIGPNWVNGIGNCIPSEGYLIKMFADGVLIYPENGEKSIITSSIKTNNFIFEGGNAADPVYSLYIAGLELGDEIAAYDGDVLIGSLKINSLNAFKNELPLFNTINSGQGYVAGHKVNVKVWDNKTSQVVNFESELLNPYGDAYTSDLYPGEDGEYSVLNITKNIPFRNDASSTLNIYPNPAKESINITSDNIIDKIEIYSISGQSIYSSVENSNNISVNIQELTQGVYLLKVFTLNDIVVKRFAVK